MARQRKSPAKKRSRVASAKKAIRRTAKKLTTKLRSSRRRVHKKPARAAAASSPRRARPAGGGKARPARRKTNVAKKAITRAAKKITTTLRPSRRRAQEEPVAAPSPQRARPAGDGKARPIHRETDVPFEVLDRDYTYSPKQTSLKASIRASGDEHQRDQELADGYTEERWRDEDRFTNKSGDPRIGTHRRKYEPGE